MICLNSTTNRSIVSSGNGYYRISALAAKYSLHPQTLRRYCNQGLVECARIPGGWRKISESSLRSHLAYPDESDTEKKGGEGTQFIYTTVSSFNQE